MIDRYEDYQRVDEIADLYGPGNRILELPVEAPLEPPVHECALGEPGQEVGMHRWPIQLRIVKAENVLCLPRRTLLDTTTGKVLLDSFRKPPEEDEELGGERLRMIDPGRVAEIMRSPDTRHVAETAFCAAAANPGYGHVLLEGISQLWAAGDFDLGSMPVAVTAPPGRTDYPLELVRPFGVSEANAVRVNKSNVFFKSLIIASQSYILQKRISTRFWRVPARIRDHYAPGAAEEPATRKLYVSRRHAPKRRLLEEEAVEEIFRERGFEILHPEQVPLAEQVRLFAGSAWVAGPVGSGLYNSVFSPRDVRRLILAPQWFFTPNDVLMSRLYGPIYMFGGGPADSQRAIVEDWSIDVDGVRRSLDRLLDEQANARSGRTTIPMVRRASTTEPMIDDYADYQRVDSIPELLGPGNRIFELPPEPPLPVPDFAYVHDVPSMYVGMARWPIDLRVVKVDDVLAMPKKTLVNGATGKLLIDSLRKPPAEDLRLPEKVQQEIAPRRIAKILASDRTEHVEGMAYNALSRNTGYGHVLLEAVSQLWPASELDLSAMHVAVNALPEGADYQFALMRPFGVTEDNAIIGSHRYIEYESLIVASQSYVLPKRVSGRFWDVVEAIRNFYAPGVAPARPSVRDLLRGEDPGLRLYVSRAKASKRRMLNEPQIEEIFRDYGFRVLYPEEETVAEQVRAFAAARWVAGSVGSGLYNSVFCVPDVRRIILAPDYFFTPNDVLMSRVHGPLYMFGRAAVTDIKQAILEDWKMDPEAVRTGLDRLFSDRYRGALPTTAWARPAVANAPSPVSQPARASSG